jgi:hypothetical protein
MRQTRRLLPFCFAAAAVLAFYTRAADEPARHRPRYTAAGLLEVPKDFRSWVFVGADLAPDFRSRGTESRQAASATESKTPKKNDVFHNIYINPESYEAYQRTGTFPDPCMLVLEVFPAEEKEVTGAVGIRAASKRIALWAAVKDRNRPGGGVPWAYYSFQLDDESRPTKPARSFPDASCYDCHVKHASKDNVWVQFYPALRDQDQVGDTP